MTGALLVVRDLAISVPRGHKRLLAVDDVGFEVEEGGSLGIVGESGSGKSLTLRALMALLPKFVRVERGTVELGGMQLPFDGRQARVQRRGRLAMIFQDPLSALDPVHTVGDQVAEVPRHVLGASAGASRRRAVELLRLVGLPDAERRAGAYPHQLSGGMRQRVLIAMALASDPKVLLCDEPTTALDVTIQAQVLELLEDLRRRLGLAIVFVSHDLAVVRQLCERLAVMYSGRLLESGPTNQLLDRPCHPYTLGLLEAAIDLDETSREPRPIPGTIPDVAEVPSGCPFHPRCRFASPDCAVTEVHLHEADAPGGEAAGGRSTACLHPDRIAAESGAGEDGCAVESGAGDAGRQAASGATGATGAPVATE